jgi:hypothetical protein
MSEEILNECIILNPQTVKVYPNVVPNRCISKSSVSGYLYNEGKDNFEIRKVVGAGSYGHVLLCKSQSNKREVVIKVDRDKAFNIWEYYIHLKVR